MSAGTALDRFPSVAGFCPSCHSHSLFLGVGGHVTCARLDCANPVAADDLLFASAEHRKELA